MNAEFESAVSLLQNSRRVVLTTHLNPDGDGLGSELALARWLAANGKSVAVFNVSPTPSFYRFLDPDKRITLFDQARDAGTVATADLIVILDTNHPARLKSLGDAVVSSPAVKLCIDHHLDPAPFANHYLIDDDATSTGEILFHLLVRLNGSALPAAIAQPLYCAIMTDSGSFRYPRVDPDVFRICAHLIECGADPVAIYAQVYEQWSPGRIHLLGEMLAGLGIEYHGALAHVTISRAMLERTGTTEEDTDNFTTFPMSVEGVKVGILFLELADGVKISFRSKGDIPINDLAKQFGGNGHKNAAGARVSGRDIGSVRREVLNAAAKFVVQ